MTITPNRLDWGEIDFQQDMPPAGYEQVEVTVENAGKKPVDITIPDFDFAELCLEGFTRAPIALPTLDAGQTYLLRVSVCAYDPTVGYGVVHSGEIDFEYDKYVQVVPWSFTPTRRIAGGDDSGDSGRSASLGRARWPR